MLSYHNRYVTLNRMKYSKHLTKYSHISYVVYSEKFIGDNVTAPFLLLFVVINCYSAYLNQGGLPPGRFLPVHMEPWDSTVCSYDFYLYMVRYRMPHVMS